MIVALGTLLQQASMFVTGIIIGRSLGADDYGVFAVLRNTVIWLLPLTTFGLDLAIQKHAVRGAGAQTFLPTYRLLRVGVFAANAALVLAFALLTHTLFARDPFWIALTLTLATLPFLSDTLLASGYFRAIGKVSVYAMLNDFLQSGLRVVLALAVVFIGPTLVAMLQVNLLVAALAWLAVASYQFRLNQAITNMTEPFAETAGQARQLVAEGIWMAVSVLIYGTLRIADLYFVGLYVSPEALGAYAAISAVALFIRLVPQALTQTLGPLISRLHEHNMRAEMQVALRGNIDTSVVAASFAFGGVAAFGPALHLLFGDSFVFDPVVCLLLSFSCLVSSALAPAGLIMSMTGLHRRETMLIVVGAISMVILLLLLTPPFGAPGAALASLISFLGINLIRIRMSEMALGLPLISSRLLVAPAFALAAAYLCAVPSAALQYDSWLALIAGGLVYTAAYGAYVWRFERPALSALNRKSGVEVTLG